jgi:membrane protease subunit HflK
MAWNEPGNKGNDPWGGGGGNRGGNQGPPDIDEIIKKFSNRLNSLFGGKSSGGSGGGGGAGAGVSAGLVGGVAVVAIIIWAAMGFYTVDEAERGVVLRFGALHDEIVMPGLRWNPPVVDQVTKVNISQVSTRSYANDMLTTDENIVHVALSVQYMVQDPVQYVIQVRDPQSGLDQAVESAIRHVVGGTTMDRVLTQGRAEAAAEVRERAQRYMDHYGTGILVTQVNVENAQPPVAVQSAFDDVIRAREDEQRAQNQALAYANRVVPEARGEAQRIIEQANAYRDQVVSRAEGEADRFDMLLVEYQGNPEVMRKRLYIDSIQEVLCNTSTVLVDVQSGNNMMMLPLGNMMAQDGAAAGAGALQLNNQQFRELSDQISRTQSTQAATGSDRGRVQTLPGRGGR